MDYRPKGEEKPPRLKLNPVRRMAIDLDFAMWRALSAVGMWYRYMDIWYYMNRTAVGDCQYCIDGGLKRYYGNKKNTIVKCLSCGAEAHCPNLYGWAGPSDKVKGPRKWTKR